jgi:hypothetical protein
MIVTHRALHRRTFLRGVGASLGLPLLDAMVPALSAAAARAVTTPVPRLGFIYIPNGVAMNATINYWRPKGEGAAFEFSPILTPLAPFRDNVVVVSGLNHIQAQPWGDGNGDHTRATATWLNGVHPKKTEGADLQAGITADQIAADVLGRDTALPSLELIASDLDVVAGQCENSYSCAYLNTLCWRTPTTPLPMENDPRAVFERLFGDGGTAAERLSRARKNRSLLDWVTDDLNRLNKSLGSGDRARVSEYVDAVREVERRIQRAEQQADGSALPEVLARPLGVPARFDEYVKLMFDLQVLAYQADITRVSTFMLGRELNSRSYPEIGVSEPHHGLSHHGNRPPQLAKYAKVNTFQSELFAYLLERLRSTRDGDATLLERSVLLYGSGLGNGNEHLHTDVALVVAGAIKGGRHLVYPLRDEVPMTNLLVSVLGKVGVNVERLGDSNGRIVDL